MASANPPDHFFLDSPAAPAVKVPDNSTTFAIPDSDAAAILAVNTSISSLKTFCTAALHTLEQQAREHAEIYNKMKQELLTNVARKVGAPESGVSYSFDFENMLLVVKQEEKKE